MRTTHFLLRVFVILSFRCLLSPQALLFKPLPPPKKRLNKTVVEMEKIVIICLACMSLLLLLIEPSSSLQLIHLQIPLYQQDKVFLSRKLKFTDEVTVKQHESQDATLNTDQHKRLPSGKAKQKEESMKESGRQGRWIEGADASQFFTMDYTHVRRRRPIHNKSLPVAP